MTFWQIWKKKMGGIYDFSEQAKKVFALAEVECRGFQQNAMRTEHLLLGLVSEGEGLAAQVLAHFGLEIDTVRMQTEWALGCGNHPATDPVKWTPRVKAMVNFAASEALRLKSPLIGTEHLLLGLIHDEASVGARILTSMGIKLEQVRQEILERVKPKKSPSESIFSTSLSV